MKRTLKAKIVNDVTVEVPIFIDSLKPKLLKEIRKEDMVYESICFGFQCATKILLVGNGISIFCEKVGILVG